MCSHVGENSQLCPTVNTVAFHPEEPHQEVQAVTSSQVSGPGPNGTEGQAEDLGDRHETNLALHSASPNTLERSDP